MLSDGRFCLRWRESCFGRCNSGHSDERYAMRSARSAHAPGNGDVKAMISLKKGDCEHCGRFYRYSLWNSGFGDTSYAYCDQCGVLALLNYANENVADLPLLSEKYAEIERSWEPYLVACACGGRFRKGAGPRCPFCNEKLSPTHAAAHIEGQSRGARGWRWQNDWSGNHCIVIDDPRNPGSLLQVLDPIANPEAESEPKPEAERTRSRWSPLFSFSK